MCPSHTAKCLQRALHPFYCRAEERLNGRAERAPIHRSVLRSFDRQAEFLEDFRIQIFDIEMWFHAMHEALAQRFRSGKQTEDKHEAYLAPCFRSFERVNASESRCEELPRTIQRQGDRQPNAGIQPATGASTPAPYYA